jgi:hypothetical protein
MTNTNGALATRNRVLAIALFVQLGLAALLWWPEDPSARAHRPLLEFGRDTIQELRISSGGLEAEQALRLVRGDSGSWEIASAGGYPALQERVDELLDALLAMSVRDAIAGQATSYESLGVADEDFGKRVGITTPQGETTLWLGAATSDSVHVRSGDSPDVYVARGISEWTLNDTASHYADANLVAADPEAISAFTLRNDAGTLSFVRTDEGWALEGAEPPIELDSAAVDSFLSAMSTLQLEEPIGREPRPEWGLAEGARIEWMEVSEDQSIAGGYSVGSDQGEHRYVQTLGGRLVALVAGSQVDALRNVRAEDFALSPAAAEPAGAPLQ